MLAPSPWGRATHDSEAVLGVSFDVRVADSLDLAAQPGVAFENLAQNVYEFDVPLTESEYRAFAQMGGGRSGSTQVRGPSFVTW